MYRVVNENPNHPPDVQAFIDHLNRDPHDGLFDSSKSDLIVARAPGRLDLMGGIADYSGSHVLEFPIAEATFAAVQLSAERHLHLVTWLDGKQEVVCIPLDPIGGLEYDAARDFFQRRAKTGWAAYVAGVFLVLMRERGLNFTSGANILISSQVPAGKGVSSSAALEVAVMQAVAAAFDICIEPRDKALLCQKVENLVVGAPCGVMDQMTAVFGEQDRLLYLLCQPAELKRMITLPRQLLVWGVDSGIRHSVSGADYGSVRAGAFMGARIIAEVKADFGYLANISPAEFEIEYLDQLPERMSGEVFLTRYQGTSDPVTSIERGKDYAVRMPTAHPIYENARVQRFVNLLDQCETVDDTEQLFHELGELMYESHQSYTALGLNSPGTDLLVELIRNEGPRAGLFGAKITGGGSGGTVAVLGDQRSRAAIERVVKSYTKETGHEPYIFTGSSSGSQEFGHLRLHV
jgi:galactokinase